MPRNPLEQPFTEWAPDKSILSASDGEAKGVYSTGGKYSPLRSLEAYGTGAKLVDRCVGARGFFSKAGASHVFAGDRTKLYKLSSRAFRDVSGGAYAISGGWSFEQFGDYIVAVARGANAQVFQIGTSSSFADLGGTPPNADVVFRVGYQLIFGYDRTLSWSAFNDIEGWNFADTATQSGQVELDATGGNIMCGVGGEVGFLFQERAIRRFTYIGPPTTWQNDPVETNRGAISRSAAVKWGRNALYVAEDGFWMFDGVQSTPLADSKVQKYFVDRLNYAARDKVSCTFDVSRKAWMVAFPTGGSTTPNEQLIWSAVDNRWTHDDQAIQYLCEIPNEGVTFDDTASLIAAFGTASLDSINVGLDDAIWKDDRRQWAGFDASNALGLFTGATRAATMETTTGEVIKGRRAYVTEVLPYIDAPAGTVTASIKSRPYILSDSKTTSEAGTLNAQGVCPVEAEGRFVSASVAVSAGAEWTEATGVLYSAKPAGDA